MLSNGFTSWKGATVSDRVFGYKRRDGMAPPAERRDEKDRGRAEAGCRQGWGEVRIIDAWGRAGSTGAFWNGLQAEVSSHSLNRWQSLTDNREFALAA